MNKLTIEEKKLIVEKVRGCETKDILGVFCLEHGYLKNWNPDQDLTQFLEMLGGFDLEIKLRVNNQLWNIHSEYRYMLTSSDGLEVFEWLCKHKYEVCKAVIEVIG